MEKIIEFCKKNKNLTYIIGVVVVLIVVLLIMKFTIFKDRNIFKKNIVNNTNANVVKTTEIDGIKIDEVKVEIVDGLSNYHAKAINTTDKDIDVKGYIINFYSNNEELGEIKIYINGVKANSTVDLINYSDMDFTKADKIEYKAIY